MRNGVFKCPICGSTHFEHINSKTHPEIFGIRCSKCIRYLGWLEKELQYSWRRGFVSMDKIEPSSDTIAYMKLLNYFKDKGFKQINATTLSNDDYVIRLDKGIATKKESKEKIPLKDFIKTI
jgi:hypothetical protein